MASTAVFCTVTRERIQKAYRDYHEQNGRFKSEKDRFRELGISAGEEGFLWKAWILALMYQGMREEQSEEFYKSIPEKSIAWSPNAIAQDARATRCRYLRHPESVHFCPYLKSDSQTCERVRKMRECPIPRLSEDTKRYSKLAKSIASLALLLEPYDFDLMQYFRRLAKEYPEDPTSVALADFTTAANSDKIAHMYLGWVSNPETFGIVNLSYERLIPIDTNIKTVVREAGISASSTSEVMRAQLYRLAKSLRLNPKIVEIGLLHVGQAYCSDDESGQDCDQCYFR